jgi:hypothetical protein
MHDVCGKALDFDSLVRLKAVQIIGDGGGEESAVEARLVLDGVDCCRVGFLGRAYIKKREAFNGKLAQVTAFLWESSNSAERKRSHYCRGVARATIVGDKPTLVASPPKPSKRSSPTDDSKEHPLKKRKGKGSI